MRAPHSLVSHDGGRGGLARPAAIGPRRRRPTAAYARPVVYTIGVSVRPRLKAHPSNIVT